MFRRKVEKRIVELVPQQATCSRKTNGGCKRTNHQNNEPQSVNALRLIVLSGMNLMGNQKRRI